MTRVGWARACIVALTMTAAIASADVFKCADGEGSISYQDTSCGASEGEVEIDGRFSNTLPMALPPAELERIAGALRKRAKEISRLLKVRSEAIERVLEQQAAREARCMEAKEAYREFLKLPRRPDSASTDSPLHRMHEACSTSSDESIPP